MISGEEDKNERREDTEVRVCVCVVGLTYYWKQFLGSLLDFVEAVLRLC